MSSGWNIGEPPRDGEPYVAIGRIVWIENGEGDSVPFVHQVAWSSTDDFSGWVNDLGLSIAFDHRASVFIDHWMPLPEGGRR